MKKNTRWGYIPKTITVGGKKLRVERGSDNPNYPLWHIPVRTSLMKDKDVNVFYGYADPEVGRMDDIVVEKKTGYFEATYLGISGESKNFRGAVKDLEKEMQRLWQHLGETLGRLI